MCGTCGTNPFCDGPPRHGGEPQICTAHSKRNLHRHLLRHAGPDGHQAKPHGNPWEPSPTTRDAIGPQRCTTKSQRCRASARPGLGRFCRGPAGIGRKMLAGVWLGFGWGLFLVVFWPVGLPRCPPGARTDPYRTTPWPQRAAADHPKVQLPPPRFFSFICFCYFYFC